MKSITLFQNNSQIQREKYKSLDIEKKMLLSEDGKMVSEEEYWKKYYQCHEFFSYEWNNGILEVRPMADYQSSSMYQWFLKILDSYFSTYPVGKIINLEIGFRIAFSNSTSVRIPDMAVVLNKNSVVIQPEDARYYGIFDLCIEQISYSALKEIKRDTVSKKAEYEGIGVKEYYILDARGKETAFYRLNRQGKYVSIKPGKGGIIESSVLKGFRFRISDLYSQPLLKNLSEDTVYQKYVIPFYQEEKQRAEQEKQRADKFEQQLLLERKHAELLAAKLKSLGISNI